MAASAIAGHHRDRGPEESGRGRADAAGIAGLAAALAGAVALVMYQGRSTLPYFDEWDLITGRRGIGAHQLFDPHNGRLETVPVLIYKVMLKGAGLDAYWAFRLLLISLVALCGGLLFAYTRPRVGMLPALALALAVVLYGQASDDLLSPAQIGAPIAILCTFAVLFVVNWRPRRESILVLVLIGVAIAASPVGLALAVGVLVEAAARRELRRAWWAPAGALAAYAVWWLAFQDHHLTLTSLLNVPRQVPAAAALTFGTIISLDSSWGRAIVVVLVILLGVLLVRWRPASLTPRFWGLAAMAAVLWALPILVADDPRPPGAQRELWATGVVAVLLVVEAAPARVKLRPRSLILMALAVGFVVLGQIGALDDGRGRLLGEESQLRARLAVVEFLGPGVSPESQPDPDRAPNVSAKGYLAAVGAWGSPVGGPTAAQRIPVPLRGQVDQLAVVAAHIGIAPVALPALGPPPAVRHIEVATSRPANGCVRVTPTSARPSKVEFVVPPRGLLFHGSRGPTAIALRRLGPGFTAQLNALDPGPWALLKIPADRLNAPWLVQLAPLGPLLVCEPAA